ncbi:MAG: Copper amine oxidase domain protein [Parcubacteria group bacterium GW2011_GWA2_51_10]|nr:MAG: Copper amine oxidase domain protein [Parcubacteria group bacterium GW2011_GWA2_51_10]
MHAMKTYRTFTMFGLLGVFLLLPFPAAAAVKYKPFEISGWIPYWRVATGTADTMPHLDALTEVNPFGYSVKTDGTLADTAKLSPTLEATTTASGIATTTIPSAWAPFIEAARAKNLRVIPTVMWSDGAAMHRILSDGPKRRALADEITKVVTENNFDGIDIDFEGKKVETKDYYSTFLEALRIRMPKKWLMCTIESRTPLEDRYHGVERPADAGLYANDLKAINKYCDRVRIMAYDQQGVDLKLAAEAASSSQLYAPVADPAWVEKVVNLMAKDIAKNKIMIGVPTYGYEYDVTAYANNEYLYDILWTFNPGYALPIAQQYGITPARNAAGELYFSYFPTGTSTQETAAPVSGLHALLAAAAASQFAHAQNSHITFRLLDWPDEQSVAQKIALAKRLGVRGVSVFKFDGGQDPDIWNVLATVGSAPAPITVPGASTLTRPLKVGQTGADVKLLQVLLNSDPDTRVAASGPGSPGAETNKFGTLTLRALEKFQIKHAIAKKGDIGFGVLGPRTRAKMNELIGMQ